MADDIVLQLRVLKDQVDDLKYRWTAHLASLKIEDNEASSNGTNSAEAIAVASIPSRIKAINARNTPLQHRLWWLFEFHYSIPEEYDLGTTAELIATHLPSEIDGLETINALLHRGLTTVELLLDELQQFVVATEIQAHGHLRRMLRMATHNINFLSCHKLEALISIAKGLEMFSEQETFEPLERAQQMLSQRLSQQLACAETQAILLLKCAHHVGLKMARQRLITEFFDCADFDELDVVSQLYEQYESPEQLFAEFAKECAHLEAHVVSANQMLITDFFGWVEGVGQAGDASC